MVDPDSRVSGKGVDFLRENGIVVDVGIEHAACMDMNKAFIHRVTKLRSNLLIALVYQPS